LLARSRDAGADDADGADDHHPEGFHRAERHLAFEGDGADDQREADEEEDALDERVADHRVAKHVGKGHENLRSEAEPR